MEQKINFDQLLTRVDSKYTMVVAAAKRARQLMDGEPPTIEPHSVKPVGVALEELAAGTLHYRRTKYGIK